MRSMRIDRLHVKKLALLLLSCAVLRFGESAASAWCQQMGGYPSFEAQAAAEAEARELRAEERRLRKETIRDQKALQRNGYYDGKVDGVSGPKMEAAVAEFRQVNNLEPDTVLDATSREVLNGASVKPSERVTMVRENQQALADLGYYDGAVDGRPGPRTQDGIRKFKETYGLEGTEATLDSAGRARLLEAQAQVKWTQSADGDGVSVMIAAPHQNGYRVRTASGDYIYEADGAAKIHSVIEGTLSSGKVQKVYIDVSELAAGRLDSFKATLDMLPKSSIQYIDANSRELLFSRSVDVLESSAPAQLPTGFWKSRLNLLKPQTNTSEVNILGRTKETVSKFTRQLRELYAGQPSEKPTLGGALNRVREHLKKTREIETDDDLMIEIERSLTGTEIIGSLPIGLPGT